MNKLDSTEILSLSGSLPHWTMTDERGGILTREFRFKDFVQAFGFMAQLAILAEKHNHHPEWFNVYDRVHITLTTHDVGGISSNDILLARLADEVYAAVSTRRPE